MPSSRGWSSVFLIAFFLFHVLELVGKLRVESILVYWELTVGRCSNGKA